MVHDDDGCFRMVNKGAISNNKSWICHLHGIEELGNPQVTSIISNDAGYTAPMARITTICFHGDGDPSRNRR